MKSLQVWSLCVRQGLAFPRELPLSPLSLISKSLDSDPAMDGLSTPERPGVPGHTSLFLCSICFPHPCLYFPPSNCSITKMGEGRQ